MLVVGLFLHSALNPYLQLPEVSAAARFGSTVFLGTPGAEGVLVCTGLNTDPTGPKFGFRPSFRFRDLKI